MRAEAARAYPMCAVRVPAILYKTRSSDTEYLAEERVIAMNDVVVGPLKTALVDIAGHEVSVRFPARHQTGDAVLD